MIAILMMSAKFANPALLKIKVFFRNKGYGNIISPHDITDTLPEKKQQKTRCSRIFSGGILREHWPQLG